MRVCRYEHNGAVEVGLYEDDRVVPLAKLAAEVGVKLPTPTSDDLLDFLPPDGKSAKAAAEAFDKWNKLDGKEKERLSRPHKGLKLRVPIPNPKKLILLAGNYADHITEGGGIAVEREQTFPYFFWKPPSTTLTNPGDPVRIPAVSPKEIDWEVELGVVIGKKCFNVSEKDALKYVAGYTVCNDISDRDFRINREGRKKRDKDSFFDWLHGKWHDTFMPVGPCVLAAGPDVDPQKWPLKLRVNDRTMQDSNTSKMIFSCAQIVAILSTFTTLEPGDVISTGTPSGVGKARKPPIFLKAGDTMEAEISPIGILRNPVK